ncbi:unnamed protein product [Camellia sinensis]
MDPHGGISSSRAEAERWLLIAEKLLAGRDLIGSKTFAIRARESEPRLEAADQILAVADTLIAGEKRINNQPDWYAILQLARLVRDTGLITTQYRRLAILLNPQRNHLPYADEAFKLVCDAWSVLFNSSTKALYDNEITYFSNPINRSQEHHEPPPPPQPQPQPHRHFKEPQSQHQHQNHDPTPSPRIISNANKEKVVSDEGELNNKQDESSTFWTACPYCYNMFEYAGVYEDCSLRCQNCQRAFHGGKIQLPASIIEGKENYFGCWGFFPMGVSMSNLEKNKGGPSVWSPFSPMFTCPQFTGKKKRNVNVRKGPWIYIEDDDVLELSESSEDSDDDEWGSTKRKKKAKKMKQKGSASKSGKKRGRKPKNAQGAGGNDLQGGSVTQEVTGAPNVSNAETSRKVTAVSAKKQTRKVSKELGKLDLNVEFSNEVEEPAPGMTGGNKAGNGEEDGMEGIGFFEGLDEFLSSLPILHVVGDDKVKAA